MAQAPRDENRVTAIIGTSNADGTTTIPVYVDSATNRLLTSGTASISTEYTEGDTSAAITGVAIMGEAAADTLQPLSLDASNYLNVNVAAGSVTVDSEFPAAAAITDNFANPTTTSVMAMGMLWDSATWDRAPGDATNGQLVNLGTNNDVTLATLPDTAAGDLAAQTTDLAAIEVLLGTIDADTSTLAGTDFMLGTDFSSVFGAASLISATPAVKVEEQGTVTVDLGANNDVTIDGSSIVHAEDSGHSSGDAGVMALAVRNDANAELSGADLDYTPIQVSSTGRARVEVNAVGTAAGDLGKAEDAQHASGDAGVAVWAVRDDDPVAATSGTAGDYEPFHTDGRGVLWTRNVPDTTDLANLSGEHVNKYYTADTPTDGIVWSPASGKRWYVTDIFINTDADAVITLEDDKTGGDEVVWKANLLANSGWSHSFKTPLYSGEDAADLIITASDGNIYVTVTGYEI